LPVIRRRDEVGSEAEPAQNPAGPGSLVAGDTDQVALLLECRKTAPGVRVQVALTEGFRLARVSASLPLGGEIETRPEELEHLAVILTARNHGAEQRRKCVTRHV